MPVANVRRFFTASIFSAVAASAFLVTPALTEFDRAQAFDCAHGPDTYRVRGVAEWDVLNIRSQPSSRSSVVARIGPDGSGIHCLGPCKRSWCRVSWRGVVGWTNMKYLGE